MINHTFKNGDTIPTIGLGTWESPKNKVADAVLYALKHGYRHIDCAHVYGNEKEIGTAFHKYFNQNLVSRDDVWITSKLWNTSHRPEQVMPALKHTLNNLQLDHLDLYLIHWPVAQERKSKSQKFIPLSEIPLTDTWEAMLELLDSGLVKHVGVCNFSIQKLNELRSASLPLPEVNQIELHPYLKQDKMLFYAQENKIVLTAYSPLGRGKVGDNPEMQPLVQNPVITNIADKIDATPAQVLLAWAIHRGTIAIPKSVTPQHIRENIAALDVTLSEQQIKKINQLDRHYRYVDGTFWTGKDSPYTLESLWDEESKHQ